MLIIKIGFLALQLVAIGFCLGVFFAYKMFTHKKLMESL